MSWSTDIDWDDLRPANLLSIITDLRDAMTERIKTSAANPPWPGFPQELTLLDSSLFTGNGFFNLFQVRMSNMLGVNFPLGPRFINHEYKSGNYTNETNITDLYWTEADMITSIGDGSRLPKPTYTKLNDLNEIRLWCIQQYKILNKLRWAFDTGVITNPQHKSVTAFPAIWAATPTQAYNNSVTLFNSTSWTNLDQLGREWSEATISDNSDGGGVKFTCTLQMQKFDLSTQNYTTALSYSTDLYTSSEQITGSTPVYDKYTNYSSRYSATPDSWQLKKQWIEQAGPILYDDYFDSTPPADFNATLPSYSGAASHYACRGTTSRAPVLFIKKFDGANGFTFKDW